MNENHQLFFLQFGKNTAAYYSRYSPRSLIVFVHGFGGSAMTTWNDFPFYIRNDDAFKYSDIIFYGYPSKKAQATGSANLFYEALGHFCTLPQQIHELNRPEASSTYDRIILIGHSLGAIIIRRALLTAYKEKAAWLSSCKMLLFAPAHNGVFIHRLAVSALTGYFSVLGVIAHYIYPVLNDLSYDAPTITELREHTLSLLASNEGDFTIASNVITSPMDKVVRLGEFCRDPATINAAAQDHVSVCKPTWQYLEPLKILLNLI